MIREVLTRAIRQLKENKRLKIEKEEVKVSLFADDMIVYMRESKNSTRELLDLYQSGWNQNKLKKISMTPIYK